MNLCITTDAWTRVSIIYNRMECNTVEWKRAISENRVTKRIITCTCFPMLAGFFILLLILITFSREGRGGEGHSNSFEGACFHLAPGLICHFIFFDSNVCWYPQKKTTVSLIIYILYKVSCISVKIVGLLSEWQFCKRLTMSFGLNRWVLLVVLHPLSTVILTVLQASLMCKPIISNHLRQNIHFYEFCCKKHANRKK